MGFGDYEEIVILPRSRLATNISALASCTSRVSWNHTRTLVIPPHTTAFIDNVNANIGIKLLRIEEAAADTNEGSSSLIINGTHDLTPRLPPYTISPSKPDEPPYGYIEFSTDFASFQIHVRTSRGDMIPRLGSKSCVGGTPLTHVGAEHHMHLWLSQPMRTFMLEEHLLDPLHVIEMCVSDQDVAKGMRTLPWVFDVSTDEDDNGIVAIFRTHNRTANYDHGTHAEVAFKLDVRAITSQVCSQESQSKYHYNIRMDLVAPSPLVVVAAAAPLRHTFSKATNTSSLAVVQMQSPPTFDDAQRASFASTWHTPLQLHTACVDVGPPAPNIHLVGEFEVKNAHRTLSQVQVHLIRAMPLPNEAEQAEPLSNPLPGFVRGEPAYDLKTAVKVAAVRMDMEVDHRRMSCNLDALHETVDMDLVRQVCAVMYLEPYAKTSTGFGLIPVRSQAALYPSVKEEDADIASDDDMPYSGRHDLCDMLEESDDAAYTKCTKTCWEAAAFASRLRQRNELAGVVHVQAAVRLTPDGTISFAAPQLPLHEAEFYRDRTCMLPFHASATKGHSFLQTPVSGYAQYGALWHEWTWRILLMVAVMLVFGVAFFRQMYTWKQPLRHARKASVDLSTAAVDVRKASSMHLTKQPMGLPTAQAMPTTPLLPTRLGAGVGRRVGRPPQPAPELAHSHSAPADLHARIPLSITSRFNHNIVYIEDL